MTKRAATVDRHSLSSVSTSQPMTRLAMEHGALHWRLIRRLAWFLADHGIMREKVENAFKRSLLSASAAPPE